MTPIDILIRSGLDPKGFVDAKKFSEELSNAVKTGFGINVGEKIAQGLEEIPAMLKEAFTEGIRFNAMIQDQVGVFTTLSGSVDDAKRRVQELVEFSEKNPIFKFQDVAESARLLQTLTDGALATEKGLEGIGNVAAASQHSITEISEVIGRLYSGLQEGLPVERATMALWRMGLISGEQARNLNEVAASGDAIGNAMRYIEPIFTKSAGAMERQTHTFNGQIEALKKNIESLSASSVKGAFDVIVVELEKLNQIISSETFKSGIETLLKVITMGPMAIPQVMKAAQDLGKAGGISGLLGAIAGGGLGALGSSIGDAGAAVGSNAAQLAALAAEMTAEARTPAGPKEMPLTDAQKQMAADVEKALTETKANGLSDREKLEQAYWQRIMEVETTFGNNHAVMQEQLAKVEEDFDRKRVLLRAQTDDEAEKNTRESLDKVEAYRKEIQQRQIQQDMDGLRLQREQFTIQRAILDADFAHPDFEKRTTRVKLLQDEIDALDQLIKKLTTAREAETDLAAKQGINQQILGLQSEKTGLEAQRVGVTNAPDPNSFEDQWTNAITKIREQWGTAAQQMGQDVQTFVNSALSETSSELARAIVVTGDFNSALRNIGETILTDIVQAIIQMIARWIAGQILAHTIGATLQGTSTATTAIQALGLAEAWAPAAMAASIATEGEADAVGSAAFGAAMMSSLSGFAGGDYTGDGNPNEVAGLAHKGEFYFTAPQTRALGVSNLRALASGANGGGGIAGALAAAGGGGAVKVQNKVNIGYLGDLNAVREFIESNEGETVIIDLINRRRLNLGLQT